MRLFEFDSEDAGYYSPDQDNYNIHQLGDTRRPQVTLRHLKDTLLSSFNSSQTNHLGRSICTSVRYVDMDMHNI